jgi:transposase
MKKVRETDCRGLKHQELTLLRKRAVQSVQEGESPEVVSKALGINRTTMYDWLAMYRKGGWQALKADKRGGRHAKLNGKALKWLYRTITQNNPQQLKFPFALWTCAMIVELIRRRFGVRLSRTSVNRLLKQLGLSAQRPLWKAYQQNPKAVEKWLKEDYPLIVREARKQKAQIYFSDEAGVRSDYHSGTTWGERGRTPVVRSTGARFGFNLISAVAPNGKLRFMVVEGTVGAAVFIGFLKRLMSETRQPVFVIVDGHPSHKAKCVKKFVEDNKQKISLYYLPGYSPELNPDELVWNSLKNGELGRRMHYTKEAMKQAAVAHLRKLQRLPKIIISFFQKPSTAYAAAL